MELKVNTLANLCISHMPVKSVLSYVKLYFINYNQNKIQE